MEGWIEGDGGVCGGIVTLFVVGVWDLVYRCSCCLNVGKDEMARFALNHFHFSILAFALKDSQAGLSQKSGRPTHDDNALDTSHHASIPVVRATPSTYV